MSPLLPEDPSAVGPYRLLGRLGAGGQGVVYLGQGPDGRTVAVKVLADGLAGDHRFAKEIDAARRVEPFCIAQVLDASLGGRPYIVTEYVEGPSLQQAGRHTGADLQRLAVATATALAAIHRAGVVHRDFKPANVLLGRDGPRVIDFGIARASDHSLTVTSSIVGTPAYMAPEQLAGAPLTPAVDVFAWASVIVFAATGSPPFGNDSLPTVIRRILHNEPYLGDLPGPLRPIVLSCLAKDPGARPAMQDVLLQLIGAPPTGTAGGTATVPAGRPGGTGGAPVGRHSGAAGDPIGRPAGTAGHAGSRPRWKAVSAGVGALVVSAALVTGAITWRRAPATTTASTPSAAAQGAAATTGTQKRGTDATPSAPPKRTRPTRTAGATSTTAPRRQRTPTPTASPPKTTTSVPRTTTTTAAAGSVSLVSLKLDGLRTEKGCWSSSLFPVATLKGPSGKQVEYGYRWIVDGQDEGWKTDWVTGTTKNQRNPLGSFEPGRHTVVFRLLTPSKASESVHFTVCQPY
ncbi:serine/threonine-protein kinase [Sphaerisporangium fuscum]|uniref:serine/threonine-protein kinase n=1 Tax=Sphaerisporangium fuscum TaxID=2835868 RepID=UPI002029A1E3|nr:serine/threonine-protein kinase [Sphaerisporangium fuscum]